MIRGTLLVALAVSLPACESMEDRTVTNVGSETVRLQLLERAPGMPDYRSPVGPPEGLATGHAIGIFIDPDFENILVVAAGDRVIGEVPLPPGGPEAVEIDAERIRAGGP